MNIDVRILTFMQQNPIVAKWVGRVGQAILGLIILFIAHLVILALSRRLMESMQQKWQSDKNKLVAYNLVMNMLYWVCMLGVVIMLVKWLGVEVAALIALLGSVLLAIGLGIQGALGDLATGCLLMVANTYKIGDYIEIPAESTIGTVKDFNLLFTEIIDEDSGVTVVIPNRKLYENVMINHTSTEQNVVVAEVVVANKNLDLGGLLSTLQSAIRAHPGVLTNKFDVRCMVSDVSALGTKIEVRYALSPGDFQVKGTYSKQTEILTRIREVVISMGIQLVEISAIGAVTTTAQTKP